MTQTKNKTRTVERVSVHIRFDPKDYKKIEAKCKETGATVTGFGRAAIIHAAEQK